jgi:integrase
MNQDIEKFLTENPLSKNTRDRYSRALALLLAEVGDLAHVGPAELLCWLDSHDCWGDSARWVALSASKRFLRWRYGESHPALKLRIRRAEAPPQRSLKLSQVEALLSSLDTSTPAGRRDLAMAGVFLDCGLRCSEVCRLQLRYVSLEERHLQVIVKGGYWSFRFYSEYTAAWLTSWLADRSTAAPNVFVSLGGTTPGKALTRAGLQRIVRNWGQRAGIGVLSPHDLRRTMASVATVLGAPEDVVMKAGGWRSHDTLRRYLVGVGPAEMQRYFPTSAAMG